MTERIDVTDVNDWVIVEKRTGFRFDSEVRFAIYRGEYDAIKIAIGPETMTSLNWHNGNTVSIKISVNYMAILIQPTQKNEWPNFYIQERGRHGYLQCRPGAKIINGLFPDLKKSARSRPVDHQIVDFQGSDCLLVELSEIVGELKEKEG